MKVLINTTSTGIYLSNEKLIEYFKRSNIQYWVYRLTQENYRNQPMVWTKIDESTINDKVKLVGKTSKYPPNHRIIISLIDHGNTTNEWPTSFNKFDRTDPIFIKMCDDGLFPDYKVVDVPDDIEWYIDQQEYDYDSYREIIRETHLIFE